MFLSRLPPCLLLCLSRSGPSAAVAALEAARKHKHLCCLSASGSGSGSGDTGDEPRLWQHSRALAAAQSARGQRRAKQGTPASTRSTYCLPICMGIFVLLALLVSWKSLPSRAEFEARAALYWNKIMKNEGTYVRQCYF